MENGRITIASGIQLTPTATMFAATVWWWAPCCKWTSNCTGDPIHYGFTQTLSFLVDCCAIPAAFAGRSYSSRQGGAARVLLRNSHLGSGCLWLDGCSTACSIGCLRVDWPPFMCICAKKVQTSSGCWRPKTRLDNNCELQLRRQTIEAPLRGSEAEALAGPSVQLVGDPVTVGLGDPGEVGAFGEVLTEEPVGVLVGPPLPGLVRRGEENGTPVAASIVR